MRLFKCLVAALIGIAITQSLSSCSPGASIAPIKSEEIHRGVNILDSDPIWKDRNASLFTARHFKVIRGGGFDFVRINTKAFRFIGSDGRLSVHYLQTLDWIIENALEAGLSVIIDEHDFIFCSKNSAQCIQNLRIFWTEISERYKNKNNKLMFEILNEPQGEMNEIWNQVVSDILPIIRMNNAARKVIIGPSNWNMFQYLEKLNLPQNDDNIIVTIHYYEPKSFTHQGAPWSEKRDLRGITWGTEADRRQVKQDFDAIALWATKNNRSVLLGEFGAYDRGGIPADMRADYVRTIAQEAEARGFSWSYWQFDGDFMLYDMILDEWIKPIKDALVAPKPS